MVGYRGIDHDDYVFPLCTDAKNFNQYVIVIIVPAKDNLFQTFHAYVERLDVPETAVWKLPVDNPLHISS